MCRRKRIDQNQGNCGKRNFITARGRVVGGTKVQLCELPWQVGIEYDEIVSAGGAILNERWIITAAHVFLSDFDCRHYRGIVGTVSLSESPIYIFFDKLIIHPKYANTTLSFANDIALLHTTADLPLYPRNKTLNSACLPQPYAEFKGRVTVSGWGSIDEQGTPTESLMAVELFVFDDKICERIYNDSYDKRIMICAGHPSGGRDSCRGDSGGPMIKFAKNVGYIIGLVSFGPRDHSCGRRNSAAVYTKVSHYVRWIHANIHNRGRL
ncbi:trypsin-1-like protein [Dinothrombium tinctorium]|uniref:Trypsin-1-like protein n=1 Tax=Dinothrombium tinctorium TaxID=1965070 RepID=A0A3S3PV79_9ACAR|nr:trypsin-1-like protein [Dinothrombium tinctorium]RWS08709.1 trypsin-1-like protein [Dinothrombium tinctorium]